MQVVNNIDRQIQYLTLKNVVPIKDFSLINDMPWSGRSFTTYPSLPLNWLYNVRIQSTVDNVVMGIYTVDNVVMGIYTVDNVIMGIYNVDNVVMGIYTV